MPSARSRLAAPILLFAAILIAALVAGPAAPSHASTHGTPWSAAPATSTLSGGASHPYSDPVYFPLRVPVRVSCVYSNCPGGYHGYWAIDFLGHLDDPIYAAGAGVFHIGNIDHSCPHTTQHTEGTWAWVDHGAGGVTRYAHLNKIIAKEGQLVTPATEIATMGHNGNTYPCVTNYIHMEWRAERVGGPRLPIPSMTACEDSTAVSFPRALGYSTWNSMPYNQITTPTTGNSCLPDFTQTPNQPRVTVTRSGHQTLLVVPSARPAGTNGVRVREEEYHPSLHEYLLLTYRDIPVSQSGTHFGGLLDGRPYRYSVAFHNAAGWSAWSATYAIAPE